MTKVTWVLLFSGMLLAGFPFLLVTTWGHGIPWVMALACLVFGAFGVYAAFAIDRSRRRGGPQARTPRPRTFR